MKQKLVQRPGATACARCCHFLTVAPGMHCTAPHANTYQVSYSPTLLRAVITRTAPTMPCRTQAQQAGLLDLSGVGAGAAISPFLASGVGGGFGAAAGLLGGGGGRRLVPAQGAIIDAAATTTFSSYSDVADAAVEGGMITIYISIPVYILFL